MSTAKQLSLQTLRLANTLASPFEWLCVCCGLALVEHYFWLMDDAFVYFRYVDNALFLKIGLVYNANEYVEGFTSPAWAMVLLMLRALHLDYRIIVRIVAWLSFIAFSLFLVQFNRRMSAGSRPVINLPLAFLSVNYGIVSYFTSGLESPLVLVWSAAFALFVLCPANPGLQVFVSIGPLVRPEFSVVWAIALVWAAYRTRKLPWVLIVTTMLTSGLYLLFRIYYYANLLPNTFYLKNDSMWRQGWDYLVQTLATYHLVELSLAGLLMAFFVRKKGGELFIAERCVIALSGVAIALYVVKIGGDARHFRYLAFSFSMAVCVLAGIPELALKYSPIENTKRLHTAAGLFILVLSHWWYPPQLDSHPLYGQPHHRPVKKITDAFVPRTDRRLVEAKWALKANVENMTKYLKVAGKFRYTGPGVDTWCSRMYMDFDRRWIHMLGLTDAILAHTVMKTDRPAHKFGLAPLAKDMLLLHRSLGIPRKGYYRYAINNDRAPDWIRRNIDAIERRIYNEHDFFENLKLALTLPEWIQP